MTDVDFLKYCLVHMYYILTIAAVMTEIVKHFVDIA